VTTIKQLYNARYTYKRSVRGSRTELQQLMMLLERDQYIHWSRCYQDSEVVSDVFWTHPDSVKLLNAFSIVLLMDSTYKTKKYRLPLLEIVGVTSTGLTFSAAFVLLSTERENNFIWSLQRLKGLFFREDVYPQVIVSDRDLALMNAISVVFPEATNILCRFRMHCGLQNPQHVFFLKNVAGSVTHNAFEFSIALRVTEPTTTTFNGEKCPPPPSSAIKLSNFHSNMKLNIQYTLPLLQLIVLLKI